MKTDAKYIIVGGTYYDKRTATGAIGQLEEARRMGLRIRLFYGDTKTGKDWQEKSDVTGRIVRSMGPVKVPILLHNQRSTGGGAILDYCIVKIETSAGRRVLYKHPNYHI